jgi:hypothetical protein
MEVYGVGSNYMEIAAAIACIYLRPRSDPNNIARRMQVTFRDIDEELTAYYGQGRQ